MGKRLKNLEDSFDARSTFTKQFDSLSFISQADDATIRTARSTASKRMSILEAVRVRFAFDDDLQSSRVYRMAKNDDCNHSVLSSAIRTQTWSIFSGLSLADISVISVVALPLYPEDIQHHVECYSFEEPGAPSATETAGTWTNQQVIVENHQPSTPEHGITRTVDITMTVAGPDGSIVTNANPESSSIAGTDSISSNMSSTRSSQDHTSSSATSVVSVPQTDPTTLSKLESGSAEVQLADTVSGSHAEKHQLDDSDNEEEDVVYPCRGCGEILEEGKAFELGKHSKAHIETTLTLHSWAPLAHRLLPLQYLRNALRFGCQLTSSRGWLAYLQQLHVFMQRVWQEDRRPSRPHWRSSLLRRLLQMPQL